jgi:uncharacterized membrane protein YeaQ/YmgE (transglycosylase-associated protein family)
MGILSWIVLGFIAGALAELATGRKTGGCLTRVALGVVGALIGGALAGDGIDELSLRSIFIAFAGATVLQLGFAALERGRK